MKPAIFSSNGERRKHGKALRGKCPRISQAEWKPRSKSQDIITLLEESGADRIAGLVPVKYQRMSVSPFTFFRGTAIIQARDLAKARVSGITVQACGDCHLANFGGFASPEHALVFDINDFDETFPASSYREHMAEFAEMRVLDVWYAQVIDAIKDYFRKDSDISVRLAMKQKQARSQTSEAVLPKLTAVVDGVRKIKDNPPVIYHTQDLIQDPEKNRTRFIEDYKTSLHRDRQHLFERFRWHDSAIKVVGVGSVGTRCYISLFLANEDDPLFLQVKEARRSVLESPRGKSRYPHQGARVVEGQRIMQAASDIFLGWARHAGHDYYFRQFRDMKISAEIDTFKPATLVAYATLCGWALARAHAKAGDGAVISGYLGSSDQFDSALTKYSEDYADQAERDFETFQKATRSGRLSTEPRKTAGLEFLP